MIEEFKERKYTEEDLVLAQMTAINAIFHGGGMDFETALREMSIVNEKYAKLAEVENLPNISLTIRKLLKEDVN